VVVTDVDVSGPTEDARREAGRYAETDPSYAEIMLVYVELGELLESGRTDPEFEAECRDLVEKSIALDKVLEAEFAERWAVWCARHMDLGGARV
jgi:hypothetical protein